MNTVVRYIVILHAHNTNDLSVSRHVIGNHYTIMHINGIEIIMEKKHRNFRGVMLFSFFEIALLGGMAQGTEIF